MIKCDKKLMKDLVDFVTEVEELTGNNDVQAALDRILPARHTGWFMKGERYQVKDQVYVILFDTPKSDIVVSVRILNADGTVFDKGAKGRGVMAKGIRDATPIKD